MKHIARFLYILCALSVSIPCVAEESQAKPSSYVLAAKTIGTGLLSLTYSALGLYSFYKGITNIRKCVYKDEIHRRNLRVIPTRSLYPVKTMAKKMVQHPVLELSSASLFFYLAAKSGAKAIDHLDQFLDEDEVII